MDREHWVKARAASGRERERDDSSWVEPGGAGDGGGFVDRRRWFTGLGCSAGRGGGQGSSLVSVNEQRRRRASLSWRLIGSSCMIAVRWSYCLGRRRI
ncbi:hypothetical protein M0R45_035836 [Rubus argutus]|uniref:Uncharacterized protein n=1 Tax=Rubus argutus TaxID=59490 RepID=A0AAW1VX59_RUBAR